MTLAVGLSRRRPAPLDPLSITGIYTRMNKLTSIKKTGNGAMIPVTREELRVMGAEIGTEVEVSVSEGRMVVAKADSGYERTRRSAEMMGAYEETTKWMRGCWASAATP